ncbi:MAG: outer membrane beta-barrel protein [Deltaproteobacteria bacterium]|nr:outer membrane beta-barrel protein [Deltaproteobacteria bacterium]MBW2339448.1 outer membrane beta-barrel protein [Deltaproteobacteria bacterium]
MSLRKILLLALGVVLLSGTVYAEDAPLHLDRKNAIALKLGWHWYETSDVFDFWHFNENNFDCPVWTFAYERMIRERLGIEVSLGLFESSESNTAGSDLAITNIFISPTAKYYLPMGDSFVFYAGAGFDYYNTKWDHKYSGAFTYAYGHDRFNTFGLHGLGGVDWYIFKDPEKYGFYGAPVSLFLEYQYTYLNIDGADDRVIRERNAQLGESNPTHDLDLGGSMVFLGIRWHY